MWKPRIKEDILKVAIECREECWDGQDAAPMTLGSVAYAARFVDLLPRNMVKRPEVVADVCGAIMFYWSTNSLQYNEKIIRLSITFDGEGVMVYEGTLETAGVNEGFHGEIDFVDTGEMPKEILDILKEHFYIEGRGDE